MEKVKAHVAQWKKDEVEGVKNYIKSYKTIGILDLTNLPSPTLQKIRAQLKNVVIVMTRLRLIKLAIESSDKKGVKELLPFVKGIPALIFSNEDSFRLSKKLIKSKIPAAAKAGQIAPTDLIAPAGPTPFTPGPIIGELGQLGIKTAVEAGKISIKDAVVVAKAGTAISDKVATLLAKLGIEPMEIGVNMVATYEDGHVYHGEVLNINEKTYIENIKKLYKESFNLALNIEYPTKETIELLVKKSWMDALALSSKIKFEANKEFKKAEKTETNEKKAEVKEQTLKEMRGEKVEAKPVQDKEFIEAENKAKEILSGLQNERAKHLKLEKPKMPRINKGPETKDIL